MLCSNYLFSIVRRKWKIRNQVNIRLVGLFTRTWTSQLQEYHSLNDYADVKNHAGKKPLLTVLSSQLFIILKNRQLEAINNCWRYHWLKFLLKRIIKWECHTRHARQWKFEPLNFHLKFFSGYDYLDFYRYPKPYMEYFGDPLFLVFFFC